MTETAWKKMFGIYAEEAINTMKKLANNNKDELDAITKEYVNKVLKIADIDSEKIDLELSDIWGYIIGKYYGRMRLENEKNKD